VHYVEILTKGSYGMGKGNLSTGKKGFYCLLLPIMPNRKQLFIVSLVFGTLRKNLRKQSSLKNYEFNRIRIHLGNIFVVFYILNVI